MGGARPSTDPPRSGSPTPSPTRRERRAGGRRGDSSTIPLAADRDQAGGSRPAYCIVATDGRSRKTRRTSLVRRFPLWSSLVLVAVVALGLAAARYTSLSRHYQQRSR